MQYIQTVIRFHEYQTDSYTLARLTYTPARNSEVGAISAVKSKISIDLPDSIIIAETEKLKKTQLRAFCIEKVPTNCIIS